MIALLLVALTADLVHAAAEPWPLTPVEIDQRIAATLADLPPPTRRAWAVDRALPALAGGLPLPAPQLDALLREVGEDARAAGGLGILQEARRLYERRELREAEARYRSISRDSPLWPQALRERAWALVLLGHDDEALGAAVSLRAPWLASQEQAEGRLLAAGALLQRCRWAEARETVAPLADRALPPLEDAAVDEVLAGTSHDEVIARAAASPLVARVRRALARRPGDADRLRALGRRLAREALGAELEEARDLRERALRLRYDALRAERHALEAGRPAAPVRAAPRAPLEDDEVVWTFDGTWWRDELGTYRYEAGAACPEGSR